MTAVPKAYRPSRRSRLVLAAALSFLAPAAFASPASLPDDERRATTRSERPPAPRAGEERVDPNNTGSTTRPRDGIDAGTGATGEAFTGFPRATGSGMSGAR